MKKNTDLRIKNKYLKEILTEQCKCVNMDIKDINFRDDYWFLEHSWTIRKEEMFRRWLIKYLRSNPKAREILMQRPNSISDDALDLVVKEWLNSYGWKLKFKDKRIN